MDVTRPYLSPLDVKLIIKRKIQIKIKIVMINQLVELIKDIITYLLLFTSYIEPDQFLDCDDKNKTGLFGCRKELPFDDDNRDDKRELDSSVLSQASMQQTSLMNCRPRSEPA